ncbi:MAG: hypothetical protein RBR08_08800 [Desulforegulaceae bacterium]|nr:hypothetical protein [Desulforegulaceae bacterium]
MENLIYKPNPSSVQYMTSNGKHFPIETEVKVIKTFEDYLHTKTQNCRQKISVFAKPNANLYSLNIFNVNAKEAQKVISNFYNFYTDNTDKNLFVAFRKYCDSNPLKFLGFAFMSPKTKNKFEKNMQTDLKKILEDINLKPIGKFILNQRYYKKIVGHFYQRFL